MLTGHDKWFSDRDRAQIQNFVLSFEPKITKIEYSSILPVGPMSQTPPTGPKAPVDSTGQKRSFWKKLF